MPKKILNGVVVGNKANKTITVLVERKYQHPVLKKVIKSKKKYSGQYEKNQCKVCVKVKIIGSKPYSKTKKFQLMVGK